MSLLRPFLPRFVRDRMERDKRERDLHKAQELQEMRDRAMRPEPGYRIVHPCRFTQKTYRKVEARRRNKRARLARKGYSVHKYRIHS